MTRFLRLVALLIFCSLVKDVVAQPGVVQKTNPTKVYMHYMPWFDGPANPVEGEEYTWGWHWKMNSRNPNTVIVATGRRSIAAHYYPIVGPYASKDPHLVEYHLLLMKYSGIDGVLVDWYGINGTNDDVGSLLDNSNALIDKTEGFGIQLGLVIEDRFWPTVAMAKNNVMYAAETYFSKPNYIRLGAGQDPLVGIFGPITHQSPNSWTDILSAAEEDITFLPLWYESGDVGTSNHDGEYAWVYRDYLTGLTNFYKNRAPTLKVAGGVAYPGFDDYYKQGGAGETYPDINHENGATLDSTLKYFDRYKANLDFLQLATMNDFGEGTMLEPTLEFGFKYLGKIQQFTGVPYDEQDLYTIYRLFVLRKKYLDDAAKQSALDNAAQKLNALQIAAALEIMEDVDGGPVTPKTIILPGKLHAERYNAQYGTQTEPAIDAGTGLSVGWIDEGDSLVYDANMIIEDENIAVFRVATFGDEDATIQLKNGEGEVLATVDIPATGGYQNWVSIDTVVALPLGEQQLVIKCISGSLCMNWIQFGQLNVFDESESDAAASLYPTIARETITLETDGSFDQFEILNMTGVPVFESELDRAHSTEINVRQIPAGLHFVRLTGKKRMKILRFVKQ